MANSVDPDQTAPIGTVCSGSRLFTSILNLSAMLGNYLQQTTSADDIFRCSFFLALKGLMESQPAYNLKPLSAHQRTPFEWHFVGGPKAVLYNVLTGRCHLPITVCSTREPPQTTPILLTLLTASVPRRLSSRRKLGVLSCVSGSRLSNQN